MQRYKWPEKDRFCAFFGNMFRWIYICATCRNPFGTQVVQQQQKNMSITKEEELAGMKQVSDAVATALKEMRNYARPGMTTKELDDFGAGVLKDFGAHSAPYMTYKFPGWTCSSVDNEFCHGIPSRKRVLQEGDLINIDVSAELDGFWSDNGGSFIIGKDIHNHQPLVDASKQILQKATLNINH